MKTVIVLCQFFVFLNSKLCQGPDGLVCCADFVWNKIENGCVPCNDGYFGINCVYTCPDLYFGKRCILRCNCSIGHCHHVHGCMTSRGPETQDDISMRLRMSENEQKCCFRMTFYKAPHQTKIAKMLPLNMLQRLPVLFLFMHLCLLSEFFLWTKSPNYCWCYGN
uniref:Protein draper-like isoform X1 n=1 Tax=Crassostrea virginica TaxID=6565 RepID=A0A8B8AXQ7_CRAVI|nr:protein draper-like isoform X1 [Crassostrea virginica]